jgi:pimeloyl-ACP methyl ester carboxylesterase
MSPQTSSPTVVLVHGAWADGSSWSRVITGLQQAGIAVTAAPIPLTSLADDVNALDRTIDRTAGPVVVAGHAYAGGVIGATKHPRVRALVYVAALAPDEGETMADVFYRDPLHPDAPELKPDDHGWIWLPVNAFAQAFAQQGSPEEHAVLAAVQRPIAMQCIQQTRAETRMERPPVLVPRRRARPDDQPDHSEVHGRTHAGEHSHARCRPRSFNHPTASCRRHLLRSRARCECLSENHS